MKVVTRIAPSPTGIMHIGTVRTALFNYLFAKKHGGTYFVRIEDTDKERNRSEWIDAIWRDFEWIGLRPDKRYIQSEHNAEHQTLLQKIIESGNAYISKEEAKDGSGREVAVVRLRNKGEKVTFNDLVRGEVTFDTTELGDFVIARAIDDPLYHFAVVVDDFNAEVTHVIRAEEHLSNTPRQILIQEALGFPRPQYAHIPLILAQDKTKLSKRKHGDSVSLEHYRNEGFLPQAIINYLALLGWNPGDEREDFSLEELIAEFDLSRVQKSGAMLDTEKFKSVNQRWMRKLSDEAYVSYGELEKVINHPHKREIITLLKERSQTFSEAKTLLRGELACLFERPHLDKDGLVSKEQHGVISVKNALESSLNLLKEISKDASIDAIKSALMTLADSEEEKGKGGRGAVLWPLRYALSGQPRSPDPFTLIFILGTEESCFRIQQAIDIL